MGKILEIKDLGVQFRHGEQTVKAVDSVTLGLFKGETLGLVGESGSGKSMTALSITKILPETAQITSGKIYFKEQNLLQSTEKQLQNIRGNEISYIFQEAAAALNPVLSIGKQIEESIILHQKKSKKEAKEIASSLLKLVKLNNIDEILNSYPHQLSGGMNQRVMIAMALGSHPSLLIADEPTTALDVTIEAEIIQMLLELKRQMEFSILFITHDLSLVEKFATRIAIMYQGRVVEEGQVHEIFTNPHHRHTQELINSIIQL